MSSLTDQIIEVSNRFGTSEYSRAGGGNASVKVDGVLWIKPSGVPLATLTAQDLVPLRLDVLLDALDNDPDEEGDPVQIAARKAQVPSYTAGRRPSVEILFHALMPEPLVLHLHPLTANALTCNQDTDLLVAELLGDQAVVVDYIDPGVPLARGIEAARDAHTERTGRPAPPITLLRNHGIIVSGDTAQQIAERVGLVTDTVRTAIDAVPQQPAPAADADWTRTVTLAVAPTLRGLLSPAADGPLAAVATGTDELHRAATAERSAILTQGPLIPDQIVYAGSLPAVVHAPRDASPDELVAATTAAVERFRGEHGKNPVVVVVPQVAVFAAGKDPGAARNALAVFTDALRVARDADRIGSVRVMSRSARTFIETWEAEAYRQQIAAGAHSGPLTGKVIVVTGGAQGFGLGIATELLAGGATVVLAVLSLSAISLVLCLPPPLPAPPSPHPELSLGNRKFGGSEIPGGSAAAA